MRSNRQLAGVDLKALPRAEPASRHAREVRRRSQYQESEHYHRRRQTRAPSVRSLGISLTAVRRRLVEKDEIQGVAGLGHRVATLARYLSGLAAFIFRNYFAETVPLA